MIYDNHYRKDNLPIQEKLVHHMIYMHVTIDLASLK